MISSLPTASTGTVSDGKRKLQIQNMNTVRLDDFVSVLNSSLLNNNNKFKLHKQISGSCYCPFDIALFSYKEGGKKKLQQQKI